MSSSPLCHAHVGNTLQRPAAPALGTRCGRRPRSSDLNAPHGASPCPCTGSRRSCPRTHTRHGGNSATRTSARLWTAQPVTPPVPKHTHTQAEVGLLTGTQESNHPPPFEQSPLLPHPPLSGRRARPHGPPCPPAVSCRRPRRPRPPRSRHSRPPRCGIASCEAPPAQTRH